MIARLIAWSARNLMLVLIATAFAVVGGIWALKNLPLDAIPDLSDTQVIVYTEFPGQAPQVVEDQVTYPLTTAMLTVPKSKVVRGFSFFGVSFVYVIFEDGTDIYWARSRVLEYLNAAGKRLPAGVTPTLGPTRPASAGSTSTPSSPRTSRWPNCARCRIGRSASALAKAEGVAEVASVGGFVKQYNVVIDPGRMRSLGIPLSKVREVIRQNNMDVGGRTVELAEHEFMVRGRGYIKNVADLERIVVKVDGGTPVLLKDIARVELGPDERRGIAELNGEGEVASGIALQRFGANALNVITNIKARLGGDRSLVAEGRRGRAGLRPLRAHLPRHRDPAPHAARGKPGGGAGVHRVPAARAQRPGGDHHAAGRHADVVPGDEAARPRLQHHEPRRHCDRHRRHDRRRHRHDRERPQASGARAARQATAGNLGRGGLARSARRCSSRCSSSRSRSCRSSRWKRRKDACSGRSPTPRRSPWRRQRCCRSRWCRR